MGEEVRVGQDIRLEVIRVVVKTRGTQREPTNAAEVEVGKDPYKG